MPTLYISLDQVSKQYDNAWAVDRVSMSIGATDFVSILGPSGSGKTTLLRIIAGLEQPTHGRVVMGGRDVTALPPHHRGVAMVFQEFLLFPHRTVRENLAFPLRMMKLPPKEIDERIGWVTGILSLEGLEGRYPNQLSGGQQQRVALGRGLVGRPKVLLLDEPLANLDRELRQEMEIEIRRHQIALGIPFIYVTHNQEEALSMSDRIAVVQKGRLEDFAPRGEVYDRPRTAFIAGFVGRSNRLKGATTASGAVSLPDFGITVTGVAPLAPNRELDVFLKSERIRLHPAGATAAGGNSVPVAIKDMILRGAFVEYILAAGAIEIIAAVPRGATEIKPGEPARLVFDGADLDVFFVEDEAAA